MTDADGAEQKAEDTKPEVSGREVAQAITELKARFGNVDEGYDTSVCLLNYRIDGSTFFNQFFVAPLRDGQGNVVNYVGVQCQVSDQFAQAIAKDEPFPAF